VLKKKFLFIPICWNPVIKWKSINIGDVVDSPEPLVK
jgi:hypothetical protein